MGLQNSQTQLSNQIATTTKMRKTERRSERSCFVYVKFEMPIRDLRLDLKKTSEIQVWISVKIYGWNNEFGSHHHLCGI